MVNFYPSKIGDRELLSFYSQHFDTVEINSTFYRIPSSETVNGWRQQTPADFVFAVKFPKSITHERILTGYQEELTYFLKTTSFLNGKLGPLLIQLPPVLQPTDFQVLENFLRDFPPQGDTP